MAETATAPDRTATDAVATDRLTVALRHALERETDPHLRVWIAALLAGEQATDDHTTPEITVSDTPREKHKLTPEQKRAKRKRYRDRYRHCDGSSAATYALLDAFDPNDPEDRELAAEQAELERVWDRMASDLTDHAK